MTNSTAASTGRRRRRTPTSNVSVVGLRLPSLVLLYVLLSQSEFTNSFGLTNRSTRSSVVQTASSAVARSSSRDSSILSINGNNQSRNSPTALNVWWFGGSDQDQGDDESCELVAVRIERPTSNSRKIAGELAIPGVTIDDAWSILTDYNRLAIHVPNLRESRITKENNKYAGSSPGDGSYECQLYQVGAQKIIGFDFSASVTMDMTERFLSGSTSNARKIYFKCAESQFFSAFDGSWTIQEQRNPTTGEKEVLCSYDVLVKPKGPVPVAALEWQIKSEVPTNLRAVKAATMGMVAAKSVASSSASSTRELATAGVSAGGPANGRNETFQTRNVGAPAPVSVRMARSGVRQLAAVMVDWERGETMAKYLE